MLFYIETLQEKKAKWLTLVDTCMLLEKYFEHLVTRSAFAKLILLFMRKTPTGY